MTSHDIFTALASLLLPPGWVFLLLFAGFVVMLVFRKKWGKQLAATSLVLLWIISTPALAGFLMGLHLSSLRPLDRAVVPQDAAGVSHTAIVVLGLGAVSKGQEYGHLGLNGESHERLRYAVNLAKSTGLPMLYAGGRLLEGDAASAASTRSEAALAQQAAKEEFGYSIRWIETRSLTVHESAAYTAEILKPQKINRILLVAHAWKTPRAVLAFRDAGFEVIPAPVDFPEVEQAGIVDYFPTSEGVRWVRNVVRERFGMLREAGR